jgi:hypothetical protein
MPMFANSPGSNFFSELVIVGREEEHASLDRQELGRLIFNIFGLLSIIVSSACLGVYWGQL